LANAPWNAELAESLKGKYCVVHATYVNDHDQVLVTEQFHGIVMDIRPDRGVWFRLKGKRDGEDWVGPPDLGAFEKAPGRGEFSLSEAGEVVVDPDYVIFWRFYDKAPESNRA
jgi:hypothetical protein